MTIAPELVSSLCVSVILGILFVYAGKKVEKADPLKRPHGIVLVAEVGIKIVYDYMKTLMPRKYEKNYYPYFSMLFAFLLVSNLWGLLGFEPPTTNYSITLALAFITFILIQWNSIKANGLGGFLKNVLIPPTNLFGMISPLLSLSIRIFANLLSGAFIMGLVYSVTTSISQFIISHIPFNFVGPFIAAPLHIYFDVFSGVIQALVFVTLSSILISIENPDD